MEGSIQVCIRGTMKVTCIKILCILMQAFPEIDSGLLHSFLASSHHKLIVAFDLLCPLNMYHQRARGTHVPTKLILLILCWNQSMKIPWLHSRGSLLCASEFSRLDQMWQAYQSYTISSCPSHQQKISDLGSCRDRYSFVRHYNWLRQRSGVCYKAVSDAKASFPFLSFGTVSTQTLDWP